MSRRISRRADRAWKRLSSWYGSRLAEQYGEHPPEDWCDLIDRTDDERLEDALLAVRRDSPVHPPTLGQLEGAVPAKRFSGPDTPSKPQMIADHALKTLGAELCGHQVAMTWTYFGPVREFEMLPKQKPPAYVSHPDPRGVWIPPCEACDKREHRVIHPELP